MTRETLVTEYTEYLTDLGRTEGITDNARLTNEINMALDCCGFYTGYDKFVCFEDEEETLFTNYAGDVVSLPVPFESISEVKVDDIVVPVENY